MSSATIIIGFIVSTVGFSIFLYGRKQKRLPQLVVGMFLLVAPMILPDPVQMSIAAGLTLLGLRMVVTRAC